MSGVAELVTSGPLILALPVAGAAGAVTFLSPLLPLVPGYRRSSPAWPGRQARRLRPPAGSPSGTFRRAAFGRFRRGADASAVAVAAPSRSLGRRRSTVPARPRAPGAGSWPGPRCSSWGFGGLVTYRAALGGLGRLLTGHARLLPRFSAG